MCRPASILAFTLSAVLSIAASTAFAQQVTVQQPFHSVSESFFERIGTQWGLNFKGGGFVNFGGGNMGMPPFGRPDPSAGINSGFGFRGGDANGQFNFAAAQGVRRSMVSQTPVVTLTNGVPGFVGDTSVSPFVVGYVPVVGNFPTIPVVMPSGGQAGVGSDAVRAALHQARTGQAGSAQAADPGQPAPPVAAQAPAPRRAPAGRPAQDDRVLPGPAPVAEPPAGAAARTVTAAQASSAGRPALSVAEARRLHAAESSGDSEEALLYWQRAAGAEQAGNLGAARVYYQMAATRATGELKQRAMDRLSAMKNAPAEQR